MVCVCGDVFFASFLFPLLEFKCDLLSFLSRNCCYKRPPYGTKTEKAACRQDNGSALMAATPMSERVTDPWMRDGNSNERADDGSASERTKVFRGYK